MDKPNLTFYLDGMQSGEGTCTETRVFQRADGPVLYVATAEARSDDLSMTKHIWRHRTHRPENWWILECPLQLGEHIGTAPVKFRNTVGTPTVLLDYTILWVSNILLSPPDPEGLSSFEGVVRLETEALLDIMRSSGYQWVVVSGETRLGGIEPTRLGRSYCDGLSLASQLIVVQACKTLLTVAGRLLKLEG